MIVTAGVFACYLHSNHCMTLQSDIYQLQEEVIDVVDLLTDEIQHSGYIGCQRLLPGMHVKSAGDRELNVANQLVVTTDSLTTRHASIEAATVNFMSQSSLIASDNIAFKKDDIVLIADCQHAEIFTVKHVHHRGNEQSILPASPLQFDYTTGAEISYFEENKFFIRKTKRRRENGKVIYALYIENITHDIRMLIDDVAEAGFDIHYQNTIPQGVLISLKLQLNDLTREWFGYAQIMH